MIESSRPSTSMPSSPTKGAATGREFTSEHYDALLRQLQLIDSCSIGEVPRAFGITSCHPGEGVTTVAVNVAVAAANALKGPILLVDANALRPALHTVFSVPMTDGLIGATQERASVFDCVVPSQIDNLSLLPAGTPAQGREPVYDATALDETLDNLKHVFPLIVFDLPPATEFTTCFALAGKLDGVVLVIEAARVDCAVAERAKSRLSASANLVGAVLNKR